MRHQRDQNRTGAATPRSEVIAFTFRDDPLPKEETTPPVIKIYFIRTGFSIQLVRCQCFLGKGFENIAGS